MSELRSTEKSWPRDQQVKEISTRSYVPHEIDGFRRCSLSKSVKEFVQRISHRRSDRGLRVLSNTIRALSVNNERRLEG